MYKLILLSIFFILVGCSKDGKGINFNNMPGLTSNENDTLTVNQTRACSPQPSNSTGGTESSTDGGVTWGSCSGYTCDASYTNVAGSCVLTNQSRACISQPPNSTGGTESSSDGGVTWGSCSGFTCDASYTNVVGICVLTNQSRSCSPQPSNSTGGTESSTDGGVTWGSCTGYTCDASYTNVAGSCVLTNQSRACTAQPDNSTGGTESSTDGGVSWGTCSGFTCNTWYIQSGNSCIPNVTLLENSDSKLSLGINGGLAISRNYVLNSWGNGTNGENGDNLGTDTGNPTRVKVDNVLSNKKFIKFVRGNTHACGIAEDNKVYCWGDNTSGQLGNNSTVSSNQPVAVSTTGVLSGKTIIDISLGYFHTCALDSTYNMYCWGNNSEGQLGIGSIVDSHIPVAITTSGVLSGKTIKQMSLGYLHTCVIASDYKVYCWGYNTDGQLGDNSTTRRTDPVAVYTGGVLSGKLAIQIASNSFSHNTCIVGSDQLGYCWGKNQYGELGNNSTTSSSVPVAIYTGGVLSGKTLSYISMGSNHACGLTTTNNIACWGHNGYYQLGDGSNTNSSVPVTRTLNGLLTGKTISSLIVNGYTSCAKTSLNEYLCWGYDGWGMLGNFTFASSSGTSTPSIIAPNVLYIKERTNKFSINTDNACAINSSNVLYCWGWNGLGTVGNNGATDKSTPDLVYTGGVLSGKLITQVSVGDGHACAISSDGNGYCWGNNPNGEFGNGASGTNSNVPVAVDMTGVLAGKKLIYISAGANFTCAIANDYHVYCWGANNRGQIGDATMTERTTPVAVDTSGLSSLNGKYVIQIETGNSTTCAIANDLTVHCWGYNNTTKGLLGANNGTWTQKTYPVAVYTGGVLSGKKIKQISGHSSLQVFGVITEDELYYSWGDSGDGALGNGTWSQSIVPTSPDLTGVLSGKTFKSISTGYAHACLLSNSNTIHCMGRGDNGQLGDNLAVASEYPVSTVLTGTLNGKTLVELSVGYYNSCAITTDNQVHCWGWNTAANFGIGNWDQYNVPVQAATSLTFSF